jgi:hypothetical protein
MYLMGLDVTICSQASAAHKSNPIKQITKQINQISRKSYFKQTNPKPWI